MEQQADGFLSFIHNSEVGGKFKVVVIGHKVIELGVIYFMLWVLFYYIPLLYVCFVTDFAFASVLDIFGAIILYMQSPQ